MSVLVVAGLVTASNAQPPSTEPFPGLREHTPAVFALTNARIVAMPGTVIDPGTVVVRDGIIVAVGGAVTVPDDAVVRDMEGRTIYAGFINAYSEAGGGDRDERRGRTNNSDEESKSGSAAAASYWNENVTPEKRASTGFTPNEKSNKELRAQGITAQLIAPGDGIIRGTSVLVSTGDSDNNRVIIRDDVALHGQLTARRGGGYPNSPMGAMSLFRQAFYDADWYQKAWEAYTSSPTLPRPEKIEALAALQPYRNGLKPVMIDAGDELYCLRVNQVASELGLKAIIRGSGNEYRRLNDIAATGLPIVVPLKFPEAPDVSTPEMAMEASLEELMHWDIAPENPGRLAAKGVAIAFTADGLKDKSEFLKQVRLAVKRGLDKDAALSALTVTPAQLFGAAGEIGTIEAGKLANFVVTDGDIFEKDTKIIETWVDGVRYAVDEPVENDARGTWSLTFDSAPSGMDSLTLKLKGSAEKLKGSIAVGPQSVDLNDAKLDLTRLAVSFKGDSLGHSGVVQLSASIEGDSLVGGLGSLPDGTPLRWRGYRTERFTEEPDTSKEESDEPPKMASFEVNYPLGAFGFDGPPPRPSAVLFRNATVWTCGPQGRIEGGSVLIRDGKIAAVGVMTPPEGVEVIDLTGKHITPGMIDCHSHIATDGGINESGQTITAEVRIGDFVDPDDMAIYRQLAGGTTAANILHGSANTIGGQNQVIKHRWGSGPEDLKFKAAPPGIKFALGENVKQSNWGDEYTSRYPQSRMGVEQLVRDEFEAALDYRDAWNEWNRTKRGLPPRRDLELDAIVEILNGDRWIHCHSYRQDEILALIRTCEEYDVQIGTFQHILEGYKVADAMAEHGVGGSSFSDWWAYKIEVYDAIPYNGALMHNAGVLVSFNSDNSELGGRLNLEAAKAVKYGGVPEEEALKFVTINPAIQLGVDNRVGSIEVGKDADLAVWSASPLSALTRCEQTWIDGRLYFSREKDAELRERDNEMRAVLIQKILDSGGGGKNASREGSKWPRHDEFCDHVDHDADEEVER
ncbi:MAG: amidohydrolase family protein [Candidatus Zixiibacteriota bacterium]